MSEEEKDKTILRQVELICDMNRKIAALDAEIHRLKNMARPNMARPLDNCQNPYPMPPWYVSS
jgi:hypothetical protein